MYLIYIRYAIVMGLTSQNDLLFNYEMYNIFVLPTPLIVIGTLPV